MLSDGHRVHILAFEKPGRRFRLAMSPQSSAPGSLMSHLVATGSTWSRSQGATPDNYIGLEPRMDQFLLTRRSRSDSSFGYRWVRAKRVQDYHGPPQGNAGERGTLGESEWC